MKLTHVRCCDFHADPRGADVPHHSSELRDCLTDALRHDHQCADRSCDIAVALEEGFPGIAYHLLCSATDDAAAFRVVNAATWQLGDDVITAEVGTHLYDCPEWDAWKTCHDAHARQCGDCNAITYAARHWEPETCGHCQRGPLVCPSWDLPSHPPAAVVHDIPGDVAWYVAPPNGMAPPYYVVITATPDDAAEIACEATGWRDDETLTVREVST